MGATKREFEKIQFEDILGEEARVYHKWLEEEEYYRYPSRNEERNKE